MNLTNPQKAAVAKLMLAQKNKYKKLLHNAHERVHIIGDHSRNFEFWFNVMGHYEYASAACERVTGYTREEFMNGEVLLEQIVHPDDAERFKTDKKGAFSGSIGKDVEYRLITKSGDERHIVLSWVPVATRWGKLIGVRGSIADITELRLYKTLVETLKVGAQKKLSGENAAGVFTIGADGLILSWSLSAQYILGYTPEASVGKDFRIMLNDKGQIDALQGKIERALRDGFVNYQTWLRHSSGERLLGDILLSKAIDMEQSPLAIICNINILNPVEASS